MAETAAAYLDIYFAAYSSEEFIYDHTQPAWDEFNRLSRLLGWDNNLKNEKRQLFKEALVRAFNRRFGMDEYDLTSWQYLYRVLKKPIPGDITTCHEAIQGIYVNLVDLVDLPDSEDAITLFNTERDLSKYTKRTKKFFPLNSSRAGGLLSHLLRKILNPPTPEGEEPEGTQPAAAGRRRRRRRKKKQ
ncbi:hypothetical protein H0H81_006158 [Sphagnurus paluster]|uniref:Uncharacterized protein n=1 Tax=Sphagnurus paluster TaxID=117069 RepID=A0A9P7KJK9_9AGAR|nr:hypothetical protein H0H81_006158 [Sphagnurus paluster]